MSEVKVFIYRNLGFLFLCCVESQNTAYYFIYTILCEDNYFYFWKTSKFYSYIYSFKVKSLAFADASSVFCHLFSSFAKES